MNQLQKFQREFLGEEYGSKDQLERQTLQHHNYHNRSSITEEEEETASDHNLPNKRTGVNADDVSFNVDSPHWSAKTKTHHIRDSSQKNFNQLDSEEKQVRWTGRTNLSQSHAAILIQFCERLAVRDALCGIHDYLQQLESIVLTMCCKENPDLYNSLIIDLQGFVDVKKSSHFEVLAVVRIQSERLTEIVSRYVSSKYNMTKFAELMYSIMSPAQMQSIGSDQNNQARTQKSFSFEVSSGGVRRYQSSGEGKFQPKSHQFQPESREGPCGETNPFILEQVSSPTKIFDAENRSDSQISTPSEDENGEFSHQNNRLSHNQRDISKSHPDESPRSPLNFQEVKLCNEMIDRLKAECQEYELTIVDQHKEISDLKKVIAGQQGNIQKNNQKTASQIDDLEAKNLVRRLQSEIKNLSEQNEQKSIHLVNGGELINGLQQQIQDLKMRLNQDDKLRQNRREGESLQQNRHLESLRTENEQLKQRFHDMQHLCKQKEQQMAQIEIQAHNTLMNAQKDAEDCIQYFKQLALSHKGKAHEVLEPILLKSGALVPQTLAPYNNQGVNQTAEKNFRDTVQNSLLSIGRSGTANKSQERVRETNQSSFLNLKNQFVDLTEDNFSPGNALPLQLQIVLGALSKAFEEISTLKSGVLSQVTQYRDLYVDQIKQFSVLTYDYLEKIEAHAFSHEQYQVEIDSYNGLVDELKQVSLQQTKHIRAQNELVLAQKEKIVFLSDYMEKQLRRKERDRQSTVKFMLSEFPMLAQTLAQTAQQIGDLQNSEYQSKNSVQELLQGYDLAKKKLLILEEELEKSLQANEDFQQCIQQSREKYDKLTELIQDVWQAEVFNFQQPSSANRHQFTFDRRADFNRSDGVGSVGSLVSSDAVPMPVNWLSEIREKIRQLREMNDCQKDECYQMLNMLNTSILNETEQLVHTDTDGQTLQQSLDGDDSSRGIEDLGSEMCNSDGNGRLLPPQIDSQRQKRIDTQQRYNLSSPSDNSRTKQGKPNRKILIQHMTEKHELNEKQIRSISADNQRGMTSQRTPKNVSFSHNVLNSSIPSPDPAKQMFLPKGAKNNQYRNELHYMLREEINRLKGDFAVSRETIIHMKADIKALRRQISDQKARADQAQFELQNQNSNQGQLLSDFEEAQTHIEDLEENLKQKETNIQQLRQELQAFETEFADLQLQLQNVVTLNNEISQQCEHWELCHQAAQQELVHVRQLNDQKVQKIQEGHEDKLKLQKKKIFEKEALIQDTLVLLEREKDFRQAIEIKRQNVSDASSETQPYLPTLEAENESLRTQLHQVKQDITAVLEQYDREHASNKQLKKKLEQAKIAHKQLIDELNQARKEMDLIGQQLNQMQSENDQLQIAIQHQQHQYQQEISQEHHVNEQLQVQVEQVTLLTEDLQHQIIGSTNDNDDLSRRVIIQEETIRQLESKIRESLADRNEDMKKIQKLREKLVVQKRQRGNSHNTHHAHSQLVGQDKRLIAEKPMISQNSQSSSQSDFGTQARQKTHNLRLEMEERNHALDETEVTSNRYRRIDRQSQKAVSNERPYSEILTQNNSVCTSGINCSLPPTYNRNRPNINIATQHNPFTNLSNLSGVFDSHGGTLDNRIPSVSCCCGNKACFSSQNNRKPSFNQPPNDIAANISFHELKWRAEAKEATRKKVKTVQKHIEDLLKYFCKQVVEKQQPQLLVTSSSQNFNLQKHVKEWSADMLLDCWNTEEGDLIEAKAYFNKYCPSVLACLKLLIDNNVKSYQEDLYRLNNAPPTLASSRFQNPLSDHDQEKFRQNVSNSQEKNTNQQQELVEAYQQLAQHCQLLLQRYLQVGRSLAGICFGGCLLVGSGFSQQTKDQVDFAMKFLAQDTNLIESTSSDTMQEILSVVDNLINCLQQIIKSSCQVILSRSSLSKSEANRMLESVQQSCEYSVGPKTTTNNHSISQSNSKVGFVVAQNQQTFALNSQENIKASLSVREKLIEVENRIKQKFQHVSKLETSLDQLLSRQNESESQLIDSSHDQSSSNTSMLTDTKTVMKLLTTVRRVVSKLKIELHQDYLQLGNINVGMLQTPSQSSSQSLSQSQNTFEAQVLGGIHTPALQPQKLGAIQNSAQNTDQESKDSLQPKNQMMGRIIEEMRGLTFEKENRPSRRTIKSHQV